MTLPLFDPPTAANQPPISRPTTAGFADGSSIRRTVIHRYGTLLHLQEGHEPREYRVIELEDGRVFEEFLDTGERVKSQFSREEVQQGIDAGKFREVRNA